MNPTLETIKKGQGNNMLSIKTLAMKVGNSGRTWEEFDRLINTNLTSFFISLFEGEVERLNALKRQIYHPTEEIFCDECGNETDSCPCEGFNEAIDQEIKHYQEIIDYLKSIV